MDLETIVLVAACLFVLCDCAAKEFECGCRMAVGAGVLRPTDIPRFQGVSVMPTPAVKPIPDGMHSLTPHLVCAGAADAIEFYQQAFGAVEEGRLPAPDGKIMHAMLRIGDSLLMLMDEAPYCGNSGPKTLKGTPVSIHLAVTNVDEVFARAIEAGAKTIVPVADMFWGDRYGVLEDPFGHHWSVATRVRELTAEETEAAMREAFCTASPSQAVA
jgi:PhnB protein